MSRYTTEVRYICEFEAGLTESKGANDIDTIITTAAPHVFNFDFPIWDEDYRLPLEKKILRHYYTREICAETVGLWKLWLEDKMNMIMPYYNQLYLSAELEFNPFHDVDVTVDRDVQDWGTSNGTTSESTNNQVVSDERMTRDLDETTRGTSTVTDAGTGTINDSGSTVTSSDNNSLWKLFSDTPQGGITGVANATIVQNSNLADYAYLTWAEHDISTGSSTVTGQGMNLRTRNTQDQQTRNTTDTTEQNGTVDNHKTEAANRQTAGTTQNAIANTEDYLEHIFGKRGSLTYSAMLLEYRKTLINIDEMVIEELKDLFFKLWD